MITKRHSEIYVVKQVYQIYRNLFVKVQFFCERNGDLVTTQSWKMFLSLTGLMFNDYFFIINLLKTSEKLSAANVTPSDVLFCPSNSPKLKDI